MEGSEATRSMEIKDIEVKQWPSLGGNLTLTVFDEKDIPIYNKVLENGQTSGSVSIDRRFVFYDHLSVSFTADNQGDSFSLVIHFE